MAEVTTQKEYCPINCRLVEMKSKIFAMGTWTLLRVCGSNSSVKRMKLSNSAEYSEVLHGDGDFGGAAVQQVHVIQIAVEVHIFVQI